MDKTLSTSMPLLPVHLAAIRDLCRVYGVARLDVFGSALTDAFDPARSDIDFLVEYDPTTDLDPWLNRHFELQRELSAVLGHPVDLVMTGGFRNPYFICAINQTRRQIYGG
jgi:predicted nucleotidyltransferase